jgi:hypothetical protein
MFRHVVWVSYTLHELMRYSFLFWRTMTLELIILQTLFTALLTLTGSHAVQGGESLVTFHEGLPLLSETRDCCCFTSFRVLSPFPY